MNDVSATTEQIVRLIQSHRFDLSDEKRMQAQLANVLSEKEIVFSREHRLSSKDIPDFLVDGVVIECKLKGQRKMDIFKQLKRYAEHDEVKALVLVTNVSMGLPGEIDGKPAYYATLSRGWI